MAFNPKSRTHPASGSAASSTRPSSWHTRFEKIDLRSLRNVCFFMQRRVRSLMQMRLLSCEAKATLAHVLTATVAKMRSIRLQSLAVFTLLDRTV